MSRSFLRSSILFVLLLLAAGLPRTACAQAANAEPRIERISFVQMGISPALQRLFNYASVQYRLPVEQIEGTITAEFKNQPLEEILRTVLMHARSAYTWRRKNGVYEIIH